MQIAELVLPVALLALPLQPCAQKRLKCFLISSTAQPSLLPPSDSISIAAAGSAVCHIALYGLAGAVLSRPVLDILRLTSGAGLTPAEK